MDSLSVSDGAEDLEVSPSQSRRKRRVETKQAAILDAAITLFARRGLHGTTLEQIAEAADVSKPNLFYYFRSKEQIYVAALQGLLDQWLEPLRAVELESDPGDAICDYIRRKIEFSRDKPDASRLFCLEMVQGAPLIGDELRSSLKELVADKAEIIRAWCAAGRLAPVDPHHLIFAIWSTTQHYADFASQVEAVIGHNLNDPVFFEETVANVQGMILDGIRPGRGWAQAALSPLESPAE